MFEGNSLREPLLDVLARYLSCRNRQKHGNNFLISCPQFCPIQFKRDCCHCCSSAFVAVQECMGLGQMISIRHCTGRERGLFVIRPVSRRHRCFQCSGITHSIQAPKLLNGPCMNSEHFMGAEEKRSDILYSGPCASWV